jgi:hypothetical protein
MGSFTKIEYTPLLVEIEENNILHEDVCFCMHLIKLYLSWKSTKQQM